MSTVAAGIAQSVAGTRLRKTSCSRAYTGATAERTCCAVLKVHALPVSDADDVCALLWRIRDVFECSVSFHLRLRNVHLALATTVPPLSRGIRSLESHAETRTNFFINPVIHTFSGSIGSARDCAGHARAIWEATRRLVAERSPRQSCQEFRVAFVRDKDSLLLASLASDFAKRAPSDLGGRLEDMLARGLKFHKSQSGIEHSSAGLRHPTKAWCIVLSWDKAVHRAARTVLDDYLQSCGLSVDCTFEHVTQSAPDTSEETTLATIAGLLVLLITGLLEDTEIGLKSRIIER